MIFSMLLFDAGRAVDEAYNRPILRNTAKYSFLDIL